MYVILAFESDNCNRWSFLRLVSICSFIPAVLISSLCESCQILYEFNALCSNMHISVSHEFNENKISKVSTHQFGSLAFFSGSTVVRCLVTAWHSAGALSSGNSLQMDYNHTTCTLVGTITDNNTILIHYFLLIDKFIL